MQHIAIMGTGTGYAGLRTDFMDVSFDDFILTSAQ